MDFLIGVTKALLPNTPPPPLIADCVWFIPKDVVRWAIYGLCFLILDSIPVCVSFYDHRVDCQLISWARTESYRWPLRHTLCTNCMVHCVARLGSSTALANSQAQPKHRNNYTAWDVQICVSRNIDTTKSSPWQERTGVSINGRKLKPGPGIPTFIPFCCTIQFAGCGQGFHGVF